ncbi:NADH-quinone oxidoreductase subunit NuoH [Candidatus Sumerlaeota bacterium]|nr:NADH-quinone oxidoreductase subunit NuoH [Candidatus Sumerlaeota bacterium]
MDLFDLITSIIKGLAFPLIPLTLVPVIVLFERKIIGWVQERPGPNRVGPWGVVQAVADAAKLIFKEDLRPAGAIAFLHTLAPALTIVTTFLTLSVVPFGPKLSFEFDGVMRTVSMSVLDLNLGLVFFLSITSISIYGIILAGWSSNNKYSLLGGLRSSAQMVSYEINLSFTLACVLILAGSFDVYDIVEAQQGGFLNWFIWRQPLAFLLFFIAQIAETNRLPFDLPEGESELTGGFHTEYSGMKFAMFFMAEYISMFVMAALVSVLFLGGFQGPVALPVSEWIGGPAWLTQALNALIGLFWLIAKIAGQIFFMIWMRATLPRLRYDQLMSLGWKVMFELATINLIYTAAVQLMFGSNPMPLFTIPFLGTISVQWIVLFALGAGVIAGVELLTQAYRRRTLNAC